MTALFRVNILPIPHPPVAVAHKDIVGYLRHLRIVERSSTIDFVRRGKGT